MRAAALLALTAAFFVPAAPAGAIPEPAPVATARGELVGSQLVEGGGLAWMDEECVRDCDAERDFVERSSLYAAPRSGGRPRTVLRRRHRGDSFVDYSFSLTRQALGLVRRVQIGGQYGMESFLRFTPAFGPPGGPLQVVRGCGPGGEAGTVSGGSFLLVETCADGSTRLVLRGLRGQSRVVWTTPPPPGVSGPFGDRRAFAVEDLQARDGYAVFSAAPWTGSGSEYDSSARRVVLVRLSDGVEVRSWLTTSTASLGDRGAVALSAGGPSPRSCRSEVVIHLLDRPEPQRVVVPRCTSGPPTFAGGRLWFLVKGPRRNSVASVDLAGRSQTRIDLGGTEASHLLVDERSVAWTARGCAGQAEIRVAPVGPRVAAPRITSCPARPAVGRVRVRRDDIGRTIASVALRCPRGCSGKLGIRRRGRALQAFTTDFEQAGRRGRHEIILNARARRLLKPSGRVRAMVRIRRTDRAAPQPGPRDFPVTLVR